MAVLAVLSAGPGAGDPPALDPLDLALVRGEAVFEALRTYSGRPFRLDAHLERLAASARAIELPLPGGLEDLAARAIDAGGGGDLVLRLICTKGPEGSGEPQGGAPVDREGSGEPQGDAPVDREGSGEPRRGAPVDREEGPGGGPVAFAICTDLPASVEDERRRGLRLVLLTTATDPLLRAAAPWLLAGVKTISYATNMAAQRTARARGADDAILVGLGGELLEAPTATLWWRVGHTLHTPSLDLGILAGITRAVLLDEAFLSSSTRELMPVVEVDGAPIADGRPGPTAGDLHAALRRLATTR
jgi:4-amino-4-deoxychorismate lyase